MENVIPFHFILMLRLCGTEKIYCKKQGWKYQRHGMNLQKRQKNLRKTEYMAVHSLAVPMI